METALASYHGTQWRCVYGWKDTGGIDGVQWAVDLEWKDSTDNWHTEEAWHEEKRRGVPVAVQRWKVATAIANCPYHDISAITRKCPTCGITHIEMAV